MFYAAYNALKAQLSTIESLKNVAWYDDGATIHTTPAVYVEILDSKTDNLSRGHQQADFQVNLHTITAAVSDKDGDIKDAQLAKHSEIDQEVYDKIMGFRATGAFDSLQQGNYAFRPQKGMIHSVQRFYSSTYRSKTATTSNIQKPEANVSARIQK